MYIMMIFFWVRISSDSDQEQVQHRLPFGLCTGYIRISTYMYCINTVYLYIRLMNNHNAEYSNKVGEEEPL